MLEYIKSQIRERSAMQVQESAVVEPSDVPNNLITEYSHLFSELDDISEEGTDYGKARKLNLDIDLDETEVGKIELDLNGDLITDIPGDATASTVTESYETMKTYDKFFEEAASQVTRLARESDDAYNKRISALADKLYEEYCVDAEAIGAFGFTKMDVTDARVPSKLNVNFGPIKEGSDTSFIGKVKAFFATDADHKITKKQLDSVRLVQEGAFANIGKPLMDYMTSKYNVPSGSSVWDVCTPNNIIVPAGNGDSFCVVLEYTNEIINQKEYFGWTRPVREGVPEDCEKFNMESFVNETHYENKDTVIQEAAIAATAIKTEKPKKKLSRFFQESIDMGTGDAGSDTDNTAEPPAMDNEGDQSVDTSSGSDSAPTDDAQPDESTDDKETAAVNNVSSEIAEKVADQTQADANNEEVTFPDETGNEGDSSVSFDSSSSDDMAPSVDDQLDELDNSGDGEDLSGEEGDEFNDETSEETDDGSIENGDIESMSMEEIMNNASDKLKSMPLSELKEFLNDNTTSDFQEAFILTKKNINKEVDVHLRKALGILNDNKMNIDKLMKKFKMEGHSLNRVLVKAAKTGDVYSSDEQNEIKKLNSTLSELMTSLKKSNDSSYVSSVKRKIEAFTKQSKVVAAFVEDKMDKPVQESFLLSNIKDKITKALIPVKGNMEELKKLHDEGTLSRGKIIKKYSAKSTNKYVSFGATTKSSNMPGSEHTFAGYSKYAVNIDAALKLLNKALRKKNLENFDIISSLADKLDLISDYIETVIDDSVENKEMIKRIGIISGEIISLIDEFIGDDVSVAGIEDPSMETPEEPVAQDTTSSEEEPVSDDDSVEEPATDDDNDSAVEETSDDDSSNEADNNEEEGEDE